jgi:chaperonin GroES
MAFTPLHDRVLLKRVSAEVRSSGGLYIPESAKEKPQQATVVAVGPGRRQADGSVRALSVKVGDTVLLGKWVENEIKLDGEDHIVIKEEDILAIIN